MELLYLLFLVSVCQAGSHSKIQRTDQDEYKDGDNAAERGTKGTYQVAGASKMSGATLVSSQNYPWILSLIEVSASVGLIKYGPAAIISGKFALTNAAHADNILNIDDVLLVSKSDTIGTFTEPNVLIRKVKETILNFASDVGFKIALILFCPRIHNTAFWAPIPKSPQTYAPGSSIEIYNFIDGLAKATTLIGPHSDCAAYLGTASYDPNFAFCTAAAGTVRINAGDYNGALVVINGVLVGINVDRGYGGEYIVNISRLLPWIQSHVDPYIYN